MNTNEEEGIIEDEGGEQPKFVEVDGKKFVDDGSGKAKMGDDGNPVPFQEVNKQFESPEAKKARLERMTEQFKKKHPELYESPTKKGKKSEELDYGQKAFLVASGVKDADEIALVKDYMVNSGKSLEEVLGSKYFQGELKGLRDEKAATAALPASGKRSGQSAADTVDYWIAKGALPPNTPDNFKLRQDVINARIKKEGIKSQFTDTPVVGKA